VCGRFKNEFQVQALKGKVREGTLSHFREISKEEKSTVRIHMREDWRSPDNCQILVEDAHGLSHSVPEGNRAHRDSSHRRVGNSRAKSLVLEIVISDFPRRSEPLISAGIHVARSWEVGV
jgi:hypothetical protein